MNAFQIIFTPASAAELARMPKELQLHILGEFRGLPQQALGTELDAFGKLEMDGRTLHRSVLAITAFNSNGTNWACSSIASSAGTRSRIFCSVPA